METTYIDSNSTYKTNGNAPIDQLLFAVESLDALSEKFKTKIVQLALWILTNHKNYEKEIEKEIHKLNADMHYVSIFSSDFSAFVNSKLKQGLGVEKYKASLQPAESIS